MVVCSVPFLQAVFQFLDFLLQAADYFLLFLHRFDQGHHKLSIANAVNAVLVSGFLHTAKIIAGLTGRLFHFLGNEAGNLHFFDIVFG